MSMLPFLNSKKMTTLIIAKRKPEGPLESIQEEGAVHPMLMAAAEDLISAIHRKDAEGVALALQAAFEMGSDQPEGEL